MYREPAARLTLAQRLSLLTISMALFTLIAAASGFVFSLQANRTLQLARLAAQQNAQILEIERTWLRLIGVLDTLTFSRPTPQTREELTASLNALEAGLEALANQPLGVTEDRIVANRQIITDLRQTYRQVRDVANLTYALASQGRWGSALQQRSVNLNELLSQSEVQLKQIIANLQADLEAQEIATRRIQNLARLSSILASALAFLLALSTALLGPSLFSRPFSELAAQLERITHGDFSPIQPLRRNDELGYLSRLLARMTDLLRSTYQELEQRVQERTQALERRSVQLRVASQVARDVASSRNLSQLLENAVTLIRDQFGFYHAGIFLLDARNEYAVLRAATGEAGRQMLARQHSLRVGQTGLVGHAAQSGQARVANDVSADEAHYKNPLLPDTRSEAAIPMNVGGRVIGVLDVQSRETNAFDPESLAILQVLADQLGIAIQNARLIGELQKSVSDLQQVFGRMEGEAWQRFLQPSAPLGYAFDGLELRPLAQTNQGENVPDTEEHKPFSVPLRVRNQVIGSLDIWPREGELSDEEVYLLATVSSRLSQVLESARLYEESRAWAAREERLNRLTASIARALSLEQALRMGAQELGQFPGVREALVIIHPSPSQASPPPEDNTLPSNVSGKEDDDGHRA